MSNNERSARRKSDISAFLTGVERIGNALPHPATLFALLALGLVFLSWLMSVLDISATSPMNDSKIACSIMLNELPDSFDAGVTPANYQE